MFDKKKVTFKADRVTVEAAVNGFTVHAWKDGDGTPKNPWRDETATADNFEEAQEWVRGFLDGPGS